MDQRDVQFIRENCTKELIQEARTDNEIAKLSRIAGLLLWAFESQTAAIEEVKNKVEKAEENRDIDSYLKEHILAVLSCEQTREDIVKEGFLEYRPKDSKWFDSIIDIKN